MTPRRDDGLRWLGLSLLLLLLSLGLTAPWLAARWRVADAILTAEGNVVDASPPAEVTAPATLREALPQERLLAALLRSDIAFGEQGQVGQPQAGQGQADEALPGSAGSPARPRATRDRWALIGSSDSAASRRLAEALALRLAAEQIWPASQPQVPAALVEPIAASEDPDAAPDLTQNDPQRVWDRAAKAAALTLAAQRRGVAPPSADDSAPAAALPAVAEDPELTRAARTALQPLPGDAAAAWAQAQSVQGAALRYPLAAEAPGQSLRRQWLDQPFALLLDVTGVQDRQGAATIVAPADGLVLFAGRYRSYGNVILLAHQPNHHSLISSAASLLVESGDPVLKGEAIARFEASETASSTAERGSGLATTGAAPQLYFELRIAGRPVDPRPWFGEPPLDMTEAPDSLALDPSASDPQAASAPARE